MCPCVAQATAVCYEAEDVDVDVEDVELALQDVDLAVELAPVLRKPLS